MSSGNTFLDQHVDLQEHSHMMTDGRSYSTDINVKSQDILFDYCVSREAVNNENKNRSKATRHSSDSAACKMPSKVVHVASTKLIRAKNIQRQPVFRYTRARLRPAARLYGYQATPHHFGQDAEKARKADEDDDEDSNMMLGSGDDEDLDMMLGGGGGDDDEEEDEDDKTAHKQKNAKQLNQSNNVAEKAKTPVKIAERSPAKSAEKTKQIPTKKADKILVKNSPSPQKSEKKVDSAVMKKALKLEAESRHGENTSLLRTLSNDFSNLYEKKSYTDCVLRVGDSRFHVHRAILSARSSVFSAMFDCDNAEKPSVQFNIPHIEAAVFGDVLYFAYSGKIRGLTTNTVMSMYSVADQLNFPQLRKKCLTFLKSNLTLNNFCKAALVAHTLGDMKLEEQVVCFFEKNFEDVLKSTSWQDFIKDKNSHAIKLLTSALKLRQPV